MRALIAAVTAAGLLSLAAPAQAIAPCVSAAEYKAAFVGKTRLNTHRLFGTSGWQIDYTSSRVGRQEHRGYHACNGDTVFVEYSDPNRSGGIALRLTDKSRGTGA